MFEHLTFIELLQKGGITVVILGLLSVVSIAVMIERAVTFRRFGRALRAAGPGAEVAPLANVFRAGATRKGAGRAYVMDAMELPAREAVSGLDRFLGRWLCIAAL